MSTPPAQPLVPPRSGATGVRPAGLDDAPAMAAVLGAAWAGLTPRPLDAAAAASAWRSAVRASDARHAVLVATQAGQVVGLAALAPADDPDLDPAGCAELTTLVVTPGARRAGHGSRLLAAAMAAATGAGPDAGGYAEAVCWVGRGRDSLDPFLRGAGWAPDGAHRELAEDAGPADPESARLTQLRLATRLGDAAVDG